MKHTPGAIRVANILIKDHWKRVHPRNHPTLIDGLATLIDRETAAPELLEACRKVTRQLQDVRDLFPTLDDLDSSWSGTDEDFTEAIDGALSAIAKAE